MIAILILICFVTGVLLLCKGYTAAGVFVLMGMAIGLKIFDAKRKADCIQEVQEFKASEYTLEYKVTTIGEQSDTTYVLTKIEED